jgi:hypothetical protein
MRTVRYCYDKGQGNDNVTFERRSRYINSLQMRQRMRTVELDHCAQNDRLNVLAPKRGSPYASVLLSDVAAR